MAYENKIAIESCVKKVHEQQETLEKTQLIINEIEEVYSKAKAFDEIKKFTTERLKEQKLTDEYDFGERSMCEETKELLEDK